MKKNTRMKATKKAKTLLKKKVKPKKNVSPPVSLSYINEKINGLSRKISNISRQVAELNKSNLRAHGWFDQRCLNIVELSKEIMRIERIIVENIVRHESGQDEGNEWAVYNMLKEKD